MKSTVKYTLKVIFFSCLIGMIIGNAVSLYHQNQLKLKTEYYLLGYKSCMEDMGRTPSKRIIPPLPSA